MFLQNIFLILVKIVDKKFNKSNDINKNFVKSFEGNLFSPFFFPHKVAVKKTPTYKCMKKNSMKSFD